MYFQKFLPFLFLTHSCCIASPTPASGDTAASNRPIPVPLDPRPLVDTHVNLRKARLVIYTVPGTSIKVRFALGHPLDEAAMGKTIRSAYDFIYFAMSLGGDGDLPPDEDPFLMNQRYGASIVAMSVPGHKMTWGLLKGVIVGLNDALFLAGMYMTASFEIWDVGTVLVGQGCLAVASPAASTVANVTSGGSLAA